MIDTMTLSLDSHDFAIRLPNRFHPPAQNLRQSIKGSNGNMKYIYNPSKAEQAKHYLPRITIYKRYFENGGYQITMKIEFSCPKILYGNNFSELRSSQFDMVLVTLHRRLAIMGIDIAIDTLRRAKVMNVHYSKNMVLNDCYCRMVINELAKLDMHKRLDLTHTEYRNGGVAVRYHSSYFNIIFYDKIMDLKQAGHFGDKRAIEADNSHQLDLLKAVPEKLEVLRFETRLSSRKMRSLFPVIGITEPLEFEALFSERISRAVLLHFWAVITEGLYMLSFDGESIENLIAEIRAAHPRMKGKTICELLGMIKASQELGICGARLALQLTSSQWYRMKRKLKELSTTRKNHRFLAVSQIKLQLEQFIPVLERDYLQRM